MISASHQAVFFNIPVEIRFFQRRQAKHMPDAIEPAEWLPETFGKHYGPFFLCHAQAFGDAFFLLLPRRQINEHARRVHHVELSVIERKLKDGARGKWIASSLMFRFFFSCFAYLIMLSA